MRIAAFLASVLCISPLLSHAQLAQLLQTDWNAPFPPHRIMDNLYYVGTEQLATYLITTPDGHILINSDFESTVPFLQQNVTALGFEFDDIEIVLGSHAHPDHMQADALVKGLTGAQVMAMTEDVPALRAMRPNGKEHPIDRELADGDEVTLGGTTLTAHRTPGHTKGCTSWAFKVEEGGQTYDALIACSLGALPTIPLVNNPDYPEIADDFIATFAKARTLSVDIFLAAHGNQYGLAEKHAKLASRAPKDPNPYIDPAGYIAYVELQERRFRELLTQQQAGTSNAASGDTRP
jgi:metallo-beta-lactamase class B